MFQKNVATYEVMSAIWVVTPKLHQGHVNFI